MILYGSFTLSLQDIRIPVTWLDSGAGARSNDAPLDMSRPPLRGWIVEKALFVDDAANTGQELVRAKMTGQELKERDEPFTSSSLDSCGKWLEKVRSV